MFVDIPQCCNRDIINRTLSNATANITEIRNNPGSINCNNIQKIVKKHSLAD